MSLIPCWVCFRTDCLGMASRNFGTIIGTTRRLEKINCLKHLTASVKCQLSTQQLQITVKSITVIMCPHDNYCKLSKFKNRDYLPFRQLCN